MTQTTNALSDFTAWDLYDRFTIHEIAMLWLKQDPKSAGFDNPAPEYTRLKSALIRAFQIGELQGWRCVRPENPDDYDPVVDDAPVDWNLTEVERQSLVEWVFKKRQRPAFLAGDLDRLIDPMELSSTAYSSIDAPDHLIPWINLLIKGYEKHWAGYDSESRAKQSPSNDDVIDWFEGKVVRTNSMTGQTEKVSKDVARVFARLIRPDDAPIGRRRDTEAQRREKHGYSLDEIRSHETR